MNKLVNQIRKLVSEFQGEELVDKINTLVVLRDSEHLAITSRVNHLGSSWDGLSKAKGQNFNHDYAVINLEKLVDRAKSHQPHQINCLGGYEFDQGKAYADLQWLAVVKQDSNELARRYAEAHKLTSIEILNGTNRKLRCDIEAYREKLDKAINSLSKAEKLITKLEKKSGAGTESKKKGRKTISKSKVL